MAGIMYAILCLHRLSIKSTFYSESLAPQQLCIIPAMYIRLGFRFHSCHEAALQALYCLKARAEYELLPVSMQVMVHVMFSEVTSFDLLPGFQCPCAPLTDCKPY